MMKVTIGLLIGFVIGLGCSFLAIPLPAPPVLVGAMLVVAMTSGYILTDKYLANDTGNDQEENCGGPTGGTKS